MPVGFLKEPPALSFDMDLSSGFKIGYVSNTHGLKGEVTVTLGDSPPLSEVSTIFVEVRGSLVPHQVERISDRGDKAFVKFEDVDTHEQAKGLKGCSLYLPRTDRPVLRRNEFYDDEIIGFSVEDQHLGTLGKVARVEVLGMNRLIAVQVNNKEVLIPVNGPFIKSITRSRKKISVELPNGFMDI